MRIFYCIMKIIRVKGSYIMAAANLTIKIDEDLEEIPNKETLEAFEEVERMKKDSSIGKSYTDVDQMIKELSK